MSNCSFCTFLPNHPQYTSFRGIAVGGINIILPTHRSLVGIPAGGYYDLRMIFCGSKLAHHLQADAPAAPCHQYWAWEWCWHADYMTFLCEVDWLAQRLVSVCSLPACEVTAPRLTKLPCTPLPLVSKGSIHSFTHNIWWCYIRCLHCLVLWFNARFSVYFLAVFLNCYMQQLALIIFIITHAFKLIVISEIYSTLCKTNVLLQ